MTRMSSSAKERLETFSKDKTALLRLLLEQKSRQGQKITPQARIQRDGVLQLPASRAQQRLWFIDQLQGGSAAYHLQLVLRLQGTLDPDALDKTLTALVHRHEALRTVFVSAEGGDTVQEIAPLAHLTLQRFDLSEGTEAEHQAQIRQHKIDEVHGRFDLRTGPLIRGRLLRLQPDDHVLLVTMHHIASDGWSLGVFFRELQALYEAFKQGGLDPLAPLPIQYADYALWQREWLKGDVLDRQLDYWRERLQGAAPHLELPTDRPRPAVQSYRGASFDFVLDESLSAQLRAFAQRHQMTLFMVLYAAWALLLSRLSAQEDVVIGTPIANRQRPELEGLIGLFVNTLALRADVQSELKVSEWLAHIKNVTISAYEHQDVPFEQVVEAVQPQRSLNRNPLFQVMLVMQNAPQGKLQLPELTVAREDSEIQFSQFDLLLSVEDCDDRLSGRLVYATDLFDAETVQRWTTCFTVLLKDMIVDGDRRIGELSMLSADERLQVTELFNASYRTFPPSRLIHEQFEQQAALAPAATAVTFEKQSLTYAELNTRANQLARFLRAKGIGADQLVGICVERSLEMVVGLLGILKAGGAYVPLDPAYPVERLDYMLGDAAPRVLLTQERLREHLPRTAAEIVALDGQWESIARYSAENLDGAEVGLNSQHLAYVIYTSGSTGKPKGVMVEHGNVTRLFAATDEWFHFGPQDVWTLFHSFAFDFSVWELWGALFYGGRVVVVPYLTARSPQDFYRLLCDEGVSVLNQTPSAFAQLIDAQTHSPAAHSLRAVVFGGEALELRTLRPWIKRNPLSKTQLINMYGITETTVHVTYRALTAPEIESGRGSPVGVPIPDLRVYLLDQHRQPVPIGVAGELYVGGAGVARGYLNRAELTAERFIRDPFSPEARARLYKSGDLGRWRADGTLEYLGRNDHQVKIRGFRIELGEIEAQLVRHGGLKDAVVLAREDVPGEKRLVAYVVAAEEGAAPDAETLRAHLKSVLPDYMVPSAFVTLSCLPLTSNGKLDRRALPAPDRDAYVSQQYEAPRGKVEESLAEIWCSLLRVERVGRQDNFFELGGHSLLIVQLMERLRRVGLSAELRRVFESPTLAELAGVLGRGAVEQFEVPPNLIPPDCEQLTPEMLPLAALEAGHIERIVQTVPGGARNIKDIYPLAPLQEGILFHHLVSDKSDTYVVPMLLALPSRKRLEKLISALQWVIDRHDVLRTAVLWQHLPRPVQVVYRRATLPIQEIELERDRDALDQLKALMRPERQRLDLRQAPLMSLWAAQDPHSEQWYALLQTHHITSDHVTLEAVLLEVALHMEGRAAGLPEPVPYRNHVAQVLAYAGTGNAEKFFRERLADLDEPTVPFGLADVHGDGSHIAQAHEELDSDLAVRVREQAKRMGVSAATLFHAATALVTAHTSNRDDVVFGSVLLGRLQGSAGAQQIMGMFINTLPLRLRLRGFSTSEFVEHAQRELVELLAHEQASLAEAQRCSGIEGSAPLFTLLLNYRHSERAAASGIQILASQERTNYPITLSVDDRGDGFSLTAKTFQSIDPRRVTSYLHTAVKSLVDALEREPEAPVLSLSILPEAERQQLLRQFNATRAPFPKEKLLQELFEEQVRRTPDAPALVYEGQSLTFAELNARANQLARCLREKGVGPDQLVGICVERSLEMIIGLLGVLKAGGAYVPLDPDYPSERLAHMLTDSAPKVLLIQEALRGRLPPADAEVIALDRDGQQIARQSTANLGAREIGLQSHHLAYVIYTSGSTGQSKGVMIEHRSVVSLWQGLEHIYRQSDGCRRIALNASFNFDSSVKQIVQLLSGRTLYLVPQKHRWDAEALLRFIDENRIDCIDCTPSQLKSWISAGLLGQKRPTLRVALLGGEAIEPELWNRLARNAWFDSYNVYGPTECTVDTTFARLEGDSGEPNIGRPMENVRVYVLDQSGQPAPVGVVGEIFIGGAGVGRGYLNRPELTNERFVRDPFSSDPQARMYMTGDLGRWRADGAIEYLGRNDQQVKIRGFRIELGEIESQLTRHEQVREAVVIAREDVPGEKRLVAYITSPDGQAPSAEELRTSLKSALPEHMVPSAFVVLKRLPLSPSGKLDRRALPAPDLSAYGSREYEAPQGEVEEILAGIWQSLLRVERVGRQDNFFELGGHSLLIVQLMERLRRVGLSAELRRVFESPTLAELAEVLGRGAVEQFEVPPNLIPADCEQITPEMLPLVALEAGHIERIVQTVPGGARNIKDIYPLAPLQEGILFHHLVSDKSDTYVVPMLLALPSRKRLEKLISALQWVIDRHDVLRTAVLWQHLPRPVQVVYRRATLPIQEIELERDRDALDQMKALMRPERQRLDLRQAPLMSLWAAQDPHSEQWYALLQTHHITSDHVTLEAVLLEVALHMEGRTAGLPEPVPYRNHVAQVLAYAATQSANAFFRERLADVDEPTVPFGLANVHADGSHIAESRDTVASIMAQRVRTQARRFAVSAATLFHAAWGLVVAKTSGREDVVFGTLLLGRLQASAGAQQIMGMFINTLPLRLRLQDLTAKELVECTQRELVDLLAHEQASLAEAQRCSGIDGTVPLFTALLNYRHSTSSAETDWTQVAGIQMVAGQERTNYPVTLSVDDLGDGFRLTAQTDRRTDPRRVIRYTQTAMQSLLDALENVPARPALELSILPAEELHRVIEQLNATQSVCPYEQLIHELFEEQVRRAPEAVAVVYEEQELTYTGLNAKANQLARYMRARGLQPEECVPVLMPRSPQMLIAQLAVLKAGGAYVPIDSKLPAERQLFMIRDCGARFVVVESALAMELEGGSAGIIDCAAAAEEIESFSTDNLSLPLSQPVPAYVMYTSGSTGTPKGVVIPHRGVVRLAINNIYAQIDSRARIAHCSNPAFDAATFEIWSALLNGARLVIVPQSVLLEVERFAEVLKQARVSVLFLTTALFNQHAAAMPGIYSGIEYVLFGGEAADANVVRNVMRDGPPQHLLNLYGPTETTTYATWYEATSVPEDAASLPIGKPVSNTQIYILDRHLQPAPIGVAGEIYIGGAGVALGYLNRPELTKERFITDPFSADPQARLYRSGDLGLLRPDGNIEYLGRNDQQVKIRGFRIELGEIEAQLRRHEQVQEAVVLARESATKEKRLVAYVTPPSEGEPNAEILRLHLKAALPDYMVPSAFVVLERLPLTPNGKLDKRALPEPELGAFATESYEAPQGEVELALAEIWQELLRVERVGRRDNFFELGGHSLQGVKLIAKVAERLGVALSVISVFQFPTVDQLAQVIESARSANADSTLAEDVEFEEGVI